MNKKTTGNLASECTHGDDCFFYYPNNGSCSFDEL
ncbi:hypothetical protein ABH902_000003 [Enterococcus sp. UD-01]|jgi:hypothetical protein